MISRLITIVYDATKDLPLVTDSYENGRRFRNARVTIPTLCNYIKTILPTGFAEAAYRML